MTDRLRDTNSSFFVNLYPYNLFRLRSEISIAFPLFQDHPFNFLEDMTTGVRYSNLFDMMVNDVVSTMSVAGQENIPVVVTETGRPSWNRDADDEQHGLQMRRSREKRTGNAVDIGRQLHSLAVRIGLDSNEFCESGFINLCSKAGEFDNARKVFDQSPHRKLGSWNAIISGLSQGGRAREGIEVFIELRRCGLLPDDVTMVSVTSACGGLGDLGLALQLHKFVYQTEIMAGKSDLLMLNSLVDMYGKCGRMDLAYRVFSRME